MDDGELKIQACAAAAGDVGSGFIHRRSNRRTWLCQTGIGLPAWIALMRGRSYLRAHEVNRSPPSDDRGRITGMLVGSLIGDAAGGPFEFQQPKDVMPWTAGTRRWSDERRLCESDLRQLAATFRLHSYENLRPEPAAYGPWRGSAPAGTVTDDTRHKIILLQALRAAVQQDALPITQRRLARSYVEFARSDTVQRRPEYVPLCHESLKEYVKAARWVLGTRDLNVALPTARLWSGLPTVSGQMALLPLAAVFPGKPEDAYRAAYALAFFDNGTAKDLNAAVVAGLSVALSAALPRRDAAAAWKRVTRAMKKVDPFRYRQVPFARRPTVQWLEFAENAASRADGNPKRLFEILEREGEVTYFWEAHFVLAAAFSFLHFCRYEPLASLQLTLDFGHDTDSVAQLVGALVGAMHGDEVFPIEMRRRVTEQLQSDYDECLGEWTDVLLDLRQQDRQIVDGPD